MASTLVVGPAPETRSWIDALRDAGHAVEHCDRVLAFQDRLAGDPVDVLLVDIANADYGEAMLMAQARSVWPDSRVIALPRDGSFRSSAIYRMGLWSPDLLLMQPVATAELVRAVAQLQIRAQVDLIVRERSERRARIRASRSSVVVQCGGDMPPIWGMKLH